ncbi:hypothetical protein A9Q98_00970 [Thalassotalea sp. 42_200_T64]|nr:hypothetical protein A9Q98_00970 [Thalassotalea sp. 42_200_T64]
MRKFLILFFMVLLSACASAPSWEGMSESEISNWKDIGVTVDQVDTYVEAGMKPEQVKVWFEQGFNNANEIIPWASNKFTPEDAAGWKASGLSVEGAFQWASNKFSYSEAKMWRDENFELDDAIDNRAKGLSPVK